MRGHPGSGRDVGAHSRDFLVRFFPGEHIFVREIEGRKALATRNSVNLRTRQVFVTSIHTEWVFMAAGALTAMHVLCHSDSLSARPSGRRFFQQ